MFESESQLLIGIINIIIRLLPELSGKELHRYPANFIKIYRNLIVAVKALSSLNLFTIQSKSLYLSSASKRIVCCLWLLPLIL